MKRHDTHMHSSGSEIDEIEDDDSHHYSFSHQSSEKSNSNENEISRISNPKSPFELNIENNNDSIISSSELENIFQGKEKPIIKEEKKRKKSKPNKNKYFIKLKKVKLNKEKDDDLIEINLTYSPLPNYDTILDNSTLNTRRNDNKNEKNLTLKKLNTDRNIRKIPKNKNEENKKEKEVLYFFCNDDNEGNKKLKRIINLVNKQKTLLLKISDKNCFTIKNFKMTNHSSKTSKRSRSEYPFGERARKGKLSEKNKITLKRYKNYNMKENNKNNNLNLSSQNPNKINYYQSASNINNINENMQINREEKDKMLYNLYCGKGDKNNINYNNMLKKHRIKSTDSLVNRRQIERANKNFNVNNILERDDNYPEYIRFMEIHNREKENRKIIKNMFRQSGNNFHDYCRHVGNDENCPVCQAMKMKNFNNIKIKGIYSAVSSLSNNSTQNSWQNRRIYSALSRILTKKQVDRNGSRSSNISHILNINKSKNANYKNNNNITNISKISNNKLNKDLKNINKNQVYPLRKLNINRAGIDPNNFPLSNKIKNFNNNNNIKYN